MYGKFGILVHINGNAPPNLDCCVCSWLYGSIFDVVLDFTMVTGQSTHQLWAAIAAHFEANKEPRTIFLSRAFHTLTQGDMYVEDYRKVMKKVADTLHDVGQPIDNDTLVLNLIHGANSRYSATAYIIASTVSITFNVTLDRLTLKELLLANEAKVTASIALVAPTDSSSHGSDCHSPSSSSTQ